ncbi:hypothetical protein NMY22_g43 [Coprinellus aureogranulatus]|nr:hypothetical protein NMY22_g43 [Coprinellus aureogranulatus]
MHIVYALILRLFHLVYATSIFFSLLWERHRRRRARSLQTTRRRIPKHLAIVFIAPPNLSKESISNVIVESVANSVQWCRQLGVPKLTVYEQHGHVTECEQEIRSRLLASPVDCETSESEVEYRPLTPPPSEHSESRPLSPSHSPSLIPVTTILITDSQKGKGTSSRRANLRRRRNGDEEASRNPLQLCLISRDASKCAIAAVATSLARNAAVRQRKGGRQATEFTLSVDALESMLENEDGLSPPDFMIVHPLSTENTSRKSPLELHGFPPWHIRLTEIYTSRTYPAKWFPSSPSNVARPLDKSIFCNALDQFAGAEMRFGK